jgi:hypothetical protein
MARPRGNAFCLPSAAKPLRVASSRSLSVLGKNSPTVGSRSRTPDPSDVVILIHVMRRPGMPRRVEVSDEPQTQHDPKNEGEITYWNSAGGRHWVERQKSQDIVLGPILQATWSERNCARASVLSISAAAPARARSRSPSGLALPGKCWALTFQRRCWRAPPSGCRPAPRQNSYAPTRRPTGSNRRLSISSFRDLASCFLRSRPGLLPICAPR